MLTRLMAGALICAPAAWAPITPAAAQGSVVADFRVALEPYGAWRHHPGFGNVWVPANLATGWRPYTVGHWVYSDEYGWYWVEAPQEADWDGSPSITGIGIVT